MKILLKLTLLSLLLNIVYAEDREGTLSVILFHNGEALYKNQVLIDGNQKLKTDKDGLAEAKLIVGFHLVEIFGKDKDGNNLGYFKKRVTIFEKKDTQVIASLSKSGSQIEVDTPIKSKEVEDKDERKATGFGLLKGKIVSTQGKVAIANARVFVRGTSIDVRTNSNGNFEAKIPSGKSVSISVVHSAYSAQTINAIFVKKDGVVRKTVQLTPASMELEEFVVLAPKIEGSLTEIVEEEKKINAIANILGSEEFSKKGDSSAANALKRVTGITLIGGKSIFVRGLGERYSNVELNSMPLPSPDPTKRVVPLDIFPSSVIGSMKVQKSGTADIPANFGGGYIDLRTKDKHEDDYIKIGFGLKGNVNTFKDVISYTGSDTDWLGYDDGYRDMPQDALNHSAVTVGERLGIYSVSALGDKFLAITKEYANRDFNIHKEALPLGGSFSIEALKNIKITDDHKISFFANYVYKQSHTYKEETFYKFSYDSATNKPIDPAISDGVNRVASSTYSHGAMINAHYSFLDILDIKYTKLFTHIGQKSTRETEGVFGSNFDYLFFSYLDWNERTLSADQFSGNFEYLIFDVKNNFNFGIEYSTALFNQPNNFLYQDYLVNDNRVFFDGSQNFLGKRINSEDDVIAGYIHNKIEKGFFSDDDYFDIGFSFSSKDRKSEYQKFFLNKKFGRGIDNFSELEGGNPNAILETYVLNETDVTKIPFLIKDLFQPADYFDAKVVQNDIFLNMFAKPIEKVEIMFGTRYVTLKQDIYQYIENNVREIEKEKETLELDDFFPSLSIKYNQDKKNIYDFAISKTFIIPDLREFSSGIYFHPFDVATVQGNPELENTNIYSLDFKYSHYFSDDEYVKTGLFYKLLDKPIEDTQLESSSLPIYSYVNSDSATLYGLELDARKKLNIFGTKLENSLKPYIGSLSNYYISGNFSYTDSQVTLTKEQEPLLTNNKRQLQGLSQFVYNASFAYDDDTTTVTLSYKKMGERIRKVGLVNNQGIKYGDTFEIPPHILDLVIIEKFDNGLTAKFKVGNILDSETVWKQDDKEIRNFTTGQTFDFSLSYKF